MAEERYTMWNLTPFERWVKDEGLSVITQQMVDLNQLDLGPWERTGCRATLLDLTEDPLEGAFINNQGTIRYLCEIPPGGTFMAEKHMYEEIFYVLGGRGATSVWYEHGPRQTFEWQTDSVFSIPLNAWHEIYNGSGSEPARLYAAMNAPMAINLYASPEFVFNCPTTFPERFDPEDELYFSGKTRKLEHRYMETNFISNVRNVGLDRWEERGPGANMMILMAGGYFRCHLSEFPVGTYKKAHSGQKRRARMALIPEIAYLFLSGEGYDLQWPLDVMPGPGVPRQRIDYHEGCLLTSGKGYHQHFNVSGEPCRYLVLNFGNPKYDGAVGIRYKGYGKEVQIDFEDEDPAIRQMFEEELRKRGVESQMPPVARAV